MAGIRRRLMISEQQQRKIEAGEVEGLSTAWEVPTDLKYYRDRLMALAGLLKVHGVFSEAHY